MQIRYLNATFGKLQRAELNLQPGLNLIYAPNESGKSTWSAFLRNMFYGLPTRDRNPLADKHRYAPWSGAPMQGRMDLLTSDGAYTAIRQTQRANSPMGSFSCIYTGTATPVPGITGPDFGQQVLGVPREVFERSAFISQSGLPVDQNSELERRIAALITTGDENTSFTDSYERLKKQLNRRKHNRTGSIPQLEKELSLLQERLEQLHILYHQLENLQTQQSRLSSQRDALQQQLHQWDVWDLLQKQRNLQALNRDVATLQQEVVHLQSQLDSRQIPDADTVHRLSAAIHHTEALADQVHQAHSLEESARQALEQLQEKLAQSPLSGYTEQEARAVPCTKPRPSHRQAARLLLFLPPLAGSLYLGYTVSQPIIPIISALLCAALSVMYYRRMQQHLLLCKFGTANPVELEQMADTYINMLEQQRQAQADLSGKAAAAQQMADNRISAQQAILQEVQRYAPAVFQVDDCATFLSHAADVHRQLADANEQLQLISLRREISQKDFPKDSPSLSDDSVVQPTIPRQQLEHQLLQTGSDLSALHSQEDRLVGQLRSLGDRSDLESQIEQLQDQLRLLQSEYDAISLAMDALSRANTTLQNRFSPELGAKAAEILSHFTGGRYDRVLLNKNFDISAQESSDPVQHSVQLLSQGTADQAYLAVRLAICQLVLPQEKSVPLILDDVFANFDDTRLHAALDWLVTESQTRQILLFTCQKREGDYLQNRTGVTLLAL